jgi:hypothetical protein
VTVLLHTVAPVFGILALGLAAARFGLLGRGGVRGLVLFVFNVAIPVLLFRSMATMTLPDVLPWRVLVAFYTGSLLTWGLGMAVGRFAFGRRTDEAAIFAMGAAFSNTVLLGIPIVLTAFGPEATLPLMIIIAFHSALFMPLTVGVITASRGNGGRVGPQLGRTILEVVRNPIILGLAVGLAVNLTGLALPAPVDHMAELLGRAAVPTALFAMGASLAGYSFLGDVPPALALSSLKLVVHPAIVWVMAVHVLGIEGIQAPVAVTMAAMPAGVNVYLFGARYQAAPDVAARTVLLTSLLSVATLSLLLVLLGA